MVHLQVETPYEMTHAEIYLALDFIRSECAPLRAGRTLGRQERTS